MTLVETMVAMAVFSVALLSVFNVGGMMYKASIDNVAAGEALHAAEGIMEQIRAQPYQAVLVPASQSTDGSYQMLVYSYFPATSVAAAEWKSIKIPVNAKDHYFVDGVSLGNQGKYTLGGPLNNIITGYQVTSAVPLDFRVKLNVTKISDGNLARGVTVELFYKFSDRPIGAGPYHDRVLRTFIPEQIL